MLLQKHFIYFSHIFKILWFELWTFTSISSMSLPNFFSTSWSFDQRCLEVICFFWNFSLTFWQFISNLLDRFAYFDNFANLTAVPNNTFCVLLPRIVCYAISISRCPVPVPYFLLVLLTKFWAQCTPILILLQWLLVPLFSILCLLSKLPLSFHHHKYLIQAV